MRAIQAIAPGPEDIDPLPGPPGLARVQALRAEVADHGKTLRPSDSGVPLRAPGVLDQAREPWSAAGAPPGPGLTTSTPPLTLRATRLTGPAACLSAARRP